MNIDKKQQYSLMATKLLMAGNNKRKSLLRKIEDEVKIRKLRSSNLTIIKPDLLYALNKNN